MKNAGPEKDGPKSRAPENHRTTGNAVGWCTSFSQALLLWSVTYFLVGAMQNATLGYQQQIRNAVD